MRKERDRLRVEMRPLTDSLPNIPKVFPSQLLERRPDIAAAERNVYAANAQLGADTAAFFPTISITGDVGFKANRIENLLEAGSLAWGISPQLYIPIFQAGKLCAQKDADIAAHKEATEFTINTAAVQKDFSAVSKKLIAAPRAHNAHCRAHCCRAYLIAGR